MRCFSCSKLSFSILCKSCQEKLFVPTITKRTVGTLEVVSFFKYSALESLLHTKHKPEGYRIFRALAQMTMRPFIEKFMQFDDKKICIVGIDERVKNGYAHVALLTHVMKHKNAIPLHGALMAKNKVNYSGKTLQYRLDHPRDFVYKGKPNIDVVLVDDIITTGITLQEAQKVLLEHGVNVLFALTLADAQE
jgi:competence protein ComFC